MTCLLVLRCIVTTHIKCPSEYHSEDMSQHSHPCHRLQSGRWYRLRHICNVVEISPAVHAAGGATQGERKVQSWELGWRNAPLRAGACNRRLRAGHVGSGAGKTFIDRAAHQHTYNRVLPVTTEHLVSARCSWLCHARCMLRNGTLHEHGRKGVNHLLASDLRSAAL